MCLASALWARVSRVVFAADRHDAAAAGFDDALYYEYFEHNQRGALMPVGRLDLTDPQAPAALDPFKAWSSLESRTDY
jgi:guanine deaminase